MLKVMQRMFSVLTVCAVFLVTNQAMAAERQYDIIVSNGSVSQEVDPDIAYINAGVTVQNKTVDGAKAESSTAINQAIAALKKQGIAEDAIKTSYYNVLPIYNYEKGKNELIGYSVNYGITVKVDDLTKVTDSVDTMLANGVNSFNGITFEVSDRKSIERQLLSMAVHNAQEKAAIVASAGGRNLGKLIAAQIGSSGGYEYTAYNNATLLARKADTAQAAMPIMSEKIKISVNVDATFELQ